MLRSLAQAIQTLWRSTSFFKYRPEHNEVSTFGCGPADFGCGMARHPNHRRAVPSPNATDVSWRNFMGREMNSLSSGSPGNIHTGIDKKAGGRRTGSPFTVQASQREIFERPGRKVFLSELNVVHAGRDCFRDLGPQTIPISGKLAAIRDVAQDH
jgi:hypothetical protein